MLQVFVEDSLGDRIWVDREDCRLFVDNILTAFGTKASPKHMLMAGMENMKDNTLGSRITHLVHMSVIWQLISSYAEEEINI